MYVVVFLLMAFEWWYIHWHWHACTAHAGIQNT